MNVVILRQKTAVNILFNPFSVVAYAVLRYVVMPQVSIAPRTR